MTVGERIKLRREQLGMSQSDLAKLMGVSRQAISKAELHDNNITTDKVSKFAKALNCTGAELMGWSKTEDIKVENLQENEIDLIKSYRELDDQAKRQLVLMIAFLKTQKDGD